MNCISKLKHISAEQQMGILSIMTELIHLQSLGVYKTVT